MFQIYDEFRQEKDHHATQICSQRPLLDSQHKASIFSAPVRLHRMPTRLNRLCTTTPLPTGKPTSQNSR